MYERQDCIDAESIYGIFLCEINLKRIIMIYNVFEISNVHNERNINLKFVILVRIRLNGFSGDCKSKK